MPSFAENGREDHIQNFAISFDQTRQGKIFLVEPHAMPYKSRFACCSVCCSCSTSLLLGYVDVSFVFKLVCPRTKQKRENRIYQLCSAVAYFTERTKRRTWSSKKTLLIRRVRFLQNLAILRTGMVHHLHNHKTAPAMGI